MKPSTKLGTIAAPVTKKRRNTTASNRAVSTRKRAPTGTHVEMNLLDRCDAELRAIVGDFAVSEVQLEHTFAYVRANFQPSDFESLADVAREPDTTFADIPQTRVEEVHDLSPDSDEKPSSEESTPLKNTQLGLGPAPVSHVDVPLEREPDRVVEAEPVSTPIDTTVEEREADLSVLSENVLNVSEPFELEPIAATTTPEEDAELHTEVNDPSHGHSFHESAEDLFLTTSETSPPASTHRISSERPVEENEFELVNESSIPNMPHDSILDLSIEVQELTSTKNLASDRERAVSALSASVFQEMVSEIRRQESQRVETSTTARSTMRGGWGAMLDESPSSEDSINLDPFTPSSEIESSLPDIAIEDHFEPVQTSETEEPSLPEIAVDLDPFSLAAASGKPMLPNDDLSEEIHDIEDDIEEVAVEDAEEVDVSDLIEVNDDALIEESIDDMEEYAVDPLENVTLVDYEGSQEWQSEHNDIQPLAQPPEPLSIKPQTPQPQYPDEIELEEP